MTEFNRGFDDHGVQVVHHFSSGLYGKEVRIPAGVKLGQHRHSFDHLSILASGAAVVAADGVEREFVGPACITIEAGKAHEVTARTDVVWFCLHATQETDASRIDHELVK